MRSLALIVGLLAFAFPIAAYSAPAHSDGKKPAAAAKAPSDDDAGGDKGGEDKTKSAALVQQIFEGGIKAYNVGKYEEALRAFEAAIRTGMPSQQMPRVLYYRGLTFRKVGKLGFAVSDLTSALWLKGGLSEAEWAEAVKARALAYQESGVKDVPPVPRSAYAEAPAPPSSAKAEAAMAAAAAGTSAAASSASTAGAQSSSGSGGIGGFFSNLFGGGSSSSEAKSAETAAAGSSEPAQAESSSWGQSTQVAPSTAETPRRPAEIGAPFVTQVASADQASSAEPEPAASAAPAAAGGNIRLQVATVRSRSEAEALAGLLVGRHGAELGGRHPEVDESVIGSMGTFYRVRVGPYANASESQHLCTALRSDGFDCLVVTE